MKRIGPIAVIGIGLLLLFGVGGRLYLDDLQAHPAALSLPERVTDLQMTDYKLAPNVAEFEHLHGKQFPLTSGAVGVYGNGQITLWAAGAPLDLLASRMVSAMQTKIAEGRSPFTPMEQYRQGNRTIYVLEGMGQRHFYFQSNNAVIWLAADPAFADGAIQQILEDYP
jgi:hypothetical protein